MNAGPRSYYARRPRTRARVRNAAETPVGLGQEDDRIAVRSGEMTPLPDCLPADVFSAVTACVADAAATMPPFTDPRSGQTVTGLSCSVAMALPEWDAIAATPACATGGEEPGEEPPERGPSRAVMIGGVLAALAIVGAAAYLFARRRRR